MKVIGQIDNETVICQISKYEIAHIFNLYSASELKENKIDISIGKEINLAQGYKFKNEISSLCRSMKESIREFKNAYDTLMMFSELVINNIPEEKKDENT